MFPSLRNRRREAEWMDDPAVDPDELEKSLAYIRRVNTLLGYTRATLGHLKRFSRAWKPGQVIRILDVATGSADVPRAILRWAQEAGFDVRVVGVDLHHSTIRTAARETTDSRLTLVEADALHLPFADESFDYALAAMFLHHLDDDAAEAALREMSRVARRGLIVADILRHYRAYAWIRLLTLTAGSMVKHDARVSVAQAFTKDEVLRLRDAAGLSFANYYRHFGHRFVLSGEKR